MGLDTTASHAMWFVALLVAGGALGTALLHQAEGLREAHDERLAFERTRLATRADIVVAQLQRSDGVVRLQMFNSGTTTLDPSRITVLFDGEPRTVSSWSAAGVAATTVWPPGTHANLTVVSEWAPMRVAATDEVGHTYIWKNSADPFLVEMTMAPEIADVPATRTRTFTLEAWDQFGDPYAVSATWTTTVAGAVVDSGGVFTAGTTLGCGVVRATAEDIVAESDVCVTTLEAKVTWVRTYDGDVETTTFVKSPPDTVTYRARLVGVEDGEAVAGADVTLVLKRPNGTTADTVSRSTGADGVTAIASYHLGGAASGTWTVEVTGVSGGGSWLVYRSDLNDQTTRTFTVT